jgi:hypothetical protein
MLASVQEKESRLTPNRLDSKVKCLASSSATFAQSRKYSTGRRSPLTSKSAKRAMISHARSIAYCSIFANASGCQRLITRYESDSRSMRIRDFSVAPLPLIVSLLSATCARDIPLRRLIRSHHIHLSWWLINQSLFIPYTLNLPFTRSDRFQFPTPHSRYSFFGQKAFQLGI